MSTRRAVILGGLGAAATLALPITAAAKPDAVIAPETAEALSVFITNPIVWQRSREECKLPGDTYYDADLQTAWVLTPWGDSFAKIIGAVREDKS